MKLTGTTSNRNGLGAVVKVTAGGHHPDEGHGRQLWLSVAQPVPAVFGLGSADAVDSIEVQWPSGKKQVVQPPFKLNSRIDVREQ